MIAQIQYLKSLAASGTDSVTYPIPKDTHAVAFKIAANFGAASSSGLTAAIQVSGNGSTFVNSAMASKLITAAASGEVETEFLYTLQDDPYKVDASPIVAVKLNLTNNDGTNAAAIAILTEIETERGR